MPTYEYECEPCRVRYQVRHGMNETRLANCPECAGPVGRVISAPYLKLRNYTSPTEAKYARMSDAEEIARERELQKDFRSIMLPGGVTG
jgi:putative FmdB family regulatory protein